MLAHEAVTHVTASYTHGNLHSIMRLRTASALFVIVILLAVAAWLFLNIRDFLAPESNVMRRWWRGDEEDRNILDPSPYLGRDVNDACSQNGDCTPTTECRSSVETS